MIETILQAAGIPFWPVQCSSPPEGSYALYFDDVEVNGSDRLEVLILRHAAMVELYAPTQDDAAEAEAAIEAQLLAVGRPWTKQARYWLNDVQRYQTIYEFDFIEKKEGQING